MRVVHFLSALAVALFC